ncbi:MFS transporter [Actinoallomurus purpureus]|uniref:MFS transporter n=1 Tax=Actinoallomurus purpureus TaxID=478114 RepID=UPI0020926DE6|nr:MFS transporter [Actinoallomurus purpureus]MCO6004095.1 MFS transporter [Actinoallomurus purpureus]
MAEALPRAVTALVGVRVLNQLGAFALPFLAVLAGPELAPAALAVFGVAALVSRWAGGLLLDRLTPRTTAALGLTATGAMLFVLAAARTPTQVVVAGGLVGLAFEIYEPATQELLARATCGGQRRRAYALLGTALVAAGAIGGLLAAVLLPLGVRRLMVADAVTCLLAAALTLFLPGGPAPPAVNGRRRWRPPAPLVRSTVAGTAFAYGYLGVLMFVPLVLLQRGAPRWLPGLAITGAALLAPLAARLSHRRLETRPHGPVLGIGSLLLGVLALLMAAGNDVPGTVPVYLAWMAVNGVVLGRWQAMIAEAAPEADRTRWFAFFGSSWGIAQPTVPTVVALAAGPAGGTAAAALLTAGVAFLAVPVLLAGPRAR